MPRRTATTRGGTSTPARRGARGRIQKNTRSRQPPSRYGQLSEEVSLPSQREEVNKTLSESEDTQPSDPEYTHLPSTNTLAHNPDSRVPSTSPPRVVTPATPTENGTPIASQPSHNISVSLEDMRALLRSHQQEIVDRVVNQLASQHSQTFQPPLPNPPELQNLERDTRPAQRQSTRSRIVKLEHQLTQLREKREQEQALTAGAMGSGMYGLNLPLIGAGSGSASAMA